MSSQPQTINSLTVTVQKQSDQDLLQSPLELQTVLPPQAICMLNDVSVQEKMHKRSAGDDEEAAHCPPTAGNTTLTIFTDIRYNLKPLDTELSSLRSEITNL